MLSLPLNKPLTQANLEKLETFLHKYKLRNLLTIHGFLSAVISGPTMIMPSEWIDFLGLNNGEFESINEAQEIMSFIMTVYNDIANQLHQQKFKFPSRYINNQDPQDAKKLWASGYMLGIAYDKDAWVINDDLLNLLLPILSLKLEDEDLQKLIHKDAVNMKPQDIREYSEAILSEAVGAIYQYWLKKRNPGAGINHRPTRKNDVGRNDPCPCGSGKKFKKCCLH